MEHVNPTGTIAGLALQWSRDVTVSIFRKENKFIDCTMSSRHFREDVFITWVYGDPDLTKQVQSESCVDLPRIL